MPKCDKNNQGMCNASHSVKTLSIFQDMLFVDLYIFG